MYLLGWQLGPGLRGEPR